MFSVRKKFSFAAAHRLAQLPEGHKCANLHGHNWNVYVTIQAECLDDYGFVIDFGELKEFQKWLDEYIDHGVIIWVNDNLLSGLLGKAPGYFKCFFMKDIPSAENLAKLFADKIYHMYFDIIDIHSICVEVEESENNIASYTLTVGGD